MKQCRKKGFTLIEVLVVIAIIALLSGLILGLASQAQKSAARSQTEAELAQLESFVTDYQMKYGRVPFKKMALTVALASANHPLADFRDPWGAPYFYVSSSPVTFYLWSVGDQPNRIPGDDDRSLFIGNPDPSFGN